MGGFVEGADRQQASFLPACFENYVDSGNPVRIIDAFVNELDLAVLGFWRVQPASTSRPGDAPGTMLKPYVYGYLHQLTSSRKLEREAGRNIELIWLTGKLVTTSRRSPTSTVTMPARSRSRASASSPSVEPLAWSAGAWLPSMGHACAR